MNTKPTMKEVAAAAGVSVMTVSRAFRSDASISDDTRERIRTVADEPVSYTHLTLPTSDLV